MIPRLRGVISQRLLPRIDGGPESLLRLDERRRLTGRPGLGPALLTQDALRAGLPAPAVTVTDTPLARETDYGRVDDHSSAVRAPGDARHTFNRVPDYPSRGADVVDGYYEGSNVVFAREHLRRVGATEYEGTAPLAEVEDRAPEHPARVDRTARSVPRLERGCLPG